MNQAQIEKAAHDLSMALGRDPYEIIPHRDLLTGVVNRFSPCWQVLAEHIRFHHMIDVVRNQAED